MLQWLWFIFYKFIGLFLPASVRVTHKTNTNSSTGRFNKSFTIIAKLPAGANGCPMRVKEIREPHNQYIVKKIVGIKYEAEKLEEVRRLTLLMHLNIIRYFDCWIEFEKDRHNFVDPVLYVQMAAYHTSLSEWLYFRQPRHINAAPILDWLEQLADGMKYCHQKAVTHTDLKPDNIFINRNNRSGHESLVIGDFGLSLGTQSYMSPEQIEYFTVKDDMIMKRKFDEKILVAINQKILDDNVTDVFSMGLIYAELLVSRVSKLVKGEVFHSIRRNRTSTIMLIDQDLPPFLKEHIKEPMLREIIYNMTYRDPQRRLTFEKVLDKLKSFRRETQL